jgi:hypothetical protein
MNVFSKSLRVKLTAATILISPFAYSEAIKPMIETTWGQGNLYQVKTPRITKSWDPQVWLGQSYLGCVTLAASQVINYFEYQDLNRLTYPSYSCYYPNRFEQAGLMSSDIDPNTGELCIDIPLTGYDFQSLSKSLPMVSIDKNNDGLIDNGIYQGFTEESVQSYQYTADFLYQMAVMLNAQFGGPDGADVVPKKLTDLFKYRLGYGKGFSRGEKMQTVFKSDGYSDLQWADLIRSELQMGRPVIYSGYTDDESSGHTFILDGYKVESGVELFHVNWGWAGAGNGYYQLHEMSDYQGRSWKKNPNVVIAIEPEKGFVLNNKKYNYEQMEEQRLSLEIQLNKNKTYTFGPINHLDGAIEFDLTSDKNSDLFIKKSQVASETNYDCKSDLKSFKNSDGRIVHKEHCVLFGPGEFYVTVKSLEEKNWINLNVKSQVTLGESVKDYKFHGTGSVISRSSENLNGYGLTQDELRIAKSDHPNHIVFFQWEVDSRDGRQIELRADTLSKATITFGDWSERNRDITLKDVNLPFVLDPSHYIESHDDGKYYTIAVAFDESINTDVTVEAIATHAQGTRSLNVHNNYHFRVNGYSWNGNSSIISNTSENLTGYGLTQDLAQIHSSSESNPVVFAQWEVDFIDGNKLSIDSGLDQSEDVYITYGLWNDRTSDVTVKSSLPYVLDFNPVDGEYYVIKVEFPKKPNTGSVDVSFEVLK